MKNLLASSCLAFVLTSTVAISQVSTGTPPFGSFGGGPFDTVNLGNLNVHFAIPVLHKTGRGTPFTYDLSYDSSIWTPVTSSGVTQWQPATNWGWRGLTEAATGYISYAISPAEPDGPNCYLTTFSNYVYHDAFGSPHPFAGVSTWRSGFGSHGCSDLFTPLTGALSADGSGYTLNVTTITGTGTLISRSGKVLYPPYNLTSGAATATDANGNQLTANSSGQFFDTLSSTTPALTVAGSGTPASPTTFAYTAPANSSATYTMHFTQYTVATKFGVSPITEYGPLSIALVSSVALPDGSSYTFSYEKTPGSSCTPLSGTYSGNCVTGRVQEVTLPTGGTVTYAYSGGTNNSGIYSDGSAAGFTRTLNPGGAWQYSRSLVTGTPGPGSAWTTTVDDPQGNQTVINFSEDGTTATPTYNLYETQRKVYQGSISPANLLATTATCYNGFDASCYNTAVNSPIYTTDSYYQLPNGNTRASHVEYNGSFNGSGLVSDDQEFGYGVALGAAPSGTYLVRETAISYANLGNGIINKPFSIMVYDYSSGTKTRIASTTYAYDGTAVTATTGTPQHVSITGARGNLTTLTTSTSSTATLSKTFTYYDTGNPSVATDVNGAQTTYVYSTSANPYNSTQTASCGKAFVTTIEEPLSLTRSMQWNCNGGIAEQTSDENGQIVRSDYTDPYFWRPADYFDQGDNETTISYTGQTAVETALQNFNGGNSASDFRTTVDGFGRTVFTQRKQGPTTVDYDTSEVDYNSLGQPSRSTMPYSSTASPTSSNTTAPAATTTYDALGRVLSVTDADGGTVSYTYTNNDVLQIVTGAQSFKEQFEYDGLGRLTSVCEISTSLPGVGTCGQTTTQQGYWTQYTYDALGHLLTVKQNAQATSGVQTRTFTYDWLGRMTSESNPETANTGSNGTTTYAYDTMPPSYAGSCGGYTGSAGDLILVSKPSTSYTCYVYDALHRVTDVGNSSQGTTNTCRRFRYDNTSGYFGKPAGITTNYTLGRLAEALTDSCLPTTDSMITDEWFGYGSRGKLTDVYEATPHSGGYYHTQASYWPNYALDTLGLYDLNGGANTSLIPLQTFGLEGEGRTSSVTAASGQNPVSSVSYTTSGTTEPIGALTQVTFGSGDSDSYQYDPNTGRMTQYSLNVNGQSLVGKLQWNSNGTLQQLAITDPFNSADNQTCNNTYDDLARVSGNNCSSTWAQTFGYDPFGNISKTGSVSWLPTYNTSTNNQYLAGWNNASYDGNGNLLNDTFNTYTWDVYGDLASANGATVTYDAFGRMVENNSGAKVLVYGPRGHSPVAWMAGQSLVQAFIPLPGGAVAAYNSSGLYQYNHADWLGSARLFSSPSRVATPAMAYAPFGEGYASQGYDYVQFTEGGYAWTVQDGTNQSGSLEDFMFRRYSPAQGRWISPDPLGVGAADPTNPQTWNRYAYVANNPLKFIDPLGLNLAFPGQCQEGNGICPDEGAGGDPSQIDGGSFVGGMVFQLTIPGYWSYTDGNLNGDGSPTWIDSSTSFISFPGSQQPPNLFIGYAPQVPAPPTPCSSAGNAPSPQQYQAMGYVAQGSWLFGPGVGVLSNGGTLAMFKRGWLLDAQVLYGGSPAYANYAYGVYASAAGIPLSVALAGANWYGANNSSYTGQTMDPNYPGIPASNVTNITNGYNSQKNGTLCSTK